MMKVLKAWNRYKYRFAPWVAQNLTENSPRVVVPHMLEEEMLSKKQVTKTLSSLCSKFIADDKERPWVSGQFDHVMNMQVCEDNLGFTIETQPSNLKDGGTGVFVSTGCIKKGSLVAIYPGTVYQPWEPVFFISVANAYLFRCADGVHIDGSKDRMSKSIYLSCARRDRHMGEFCCDIGWLEDMPLNPLAIGQYVNNQTPECPANVAYQEFEIPEDFPWEYRRFIPNIEARTQSDASIEAYDYDRLLKTVVLVALRDIEVGEEIYSSYYTIVCGDEGEQVQGEEEHVEREIEEEQKKVDTTLEEVKRNTHTSGNTERKKMRT